MIGMDLAQQNEAVRVLIGLAVTGILASGVGHLVARVANSIPVAPPSDDPEVMKAWDTLMKQTTGGSWIGRVESPIFFAACWTQGWLLLTGWLVFKLGFYWQSTNFATFPAEMPSGVLLRWIAARRQLGTHHVATALTGTGANIVAALIGAAVGKSITLY
jgi:hypothetical protein